MCLIFITAVNLNPAPDNTQYTNPEYIPPRTNTYEVNPNNVFGNPNAGNYPQHGQPQAPLDYIPPRLPDNRQPFPASPNQGGSYQFPYYHDSLTPPPNVFGPFKNNVYVTTTREPSLLNQFFNNKQTRNFSNQTNPSLNLTLFSLLFLLIYTIRRNLF
jgi:hypothetical protein